MVDKYPGSFMEFQRESIFVSALRSFTRFFFAIFGIFFALLICSLIYLGLSPSPLLEEMTELQILPDAEGNRELVSASAPVILEIPIHGVIGDPQHLNTESFASILLDSRTGLLRKDRVKAILLSFNTPGGTVVDADNIYRMLQQYKEKHKVPIYGFVDGLCASGGMYIASAAQQLYAGPASTIGSVGVLLGPFFNISDTLGKLGMQARTLTEGLDKDMMNPTRPWKAGEEASLQTLMAFFYNQFVEIVTTARPRLDRNKLVQEYGAKIFNCVEAERLGYVDFAMISRKEALLGLMKAAQIDSKKPYQVVSLAPKTDWISQLVKGSSSLLSGKVEHKIDFGQSPIHDQLSYLYQP